MRKAGSAPQSHCVIQAEGGATTWSLASYHSRRKLTENSHVGLLDGSLVRTLHFHCRRHRFDPWQGKFCMPRCVAKKKEGELTPVLYTLAQKGLPHSSPQPIDQNQ